MREDFSAPFYSPTIHHVTSYEQHLPPKMDIIHNPSMFCQDLQPTAICPPAK